MGWPAALRYGAVLFLCIFITALALDFILMSAGLVPQGPRQAHVMTLGVKLDTTTFLNIVFIPLACWAWWRGKQAA